MNSRPRACTPNVGRGPWFIIPSYRLPHSTRTAYTPSGGSSLRDRRREVIVGTRSSVPARAPLHHGPQACTGDPPALGRRQVTVAAAVRIRRTRSPCPSSVHGPGRRPWQPVLARQPAAPSLRRPRARARTHGRTPDQASASRRRRSTSRTTPLERAAASSGVNATLDRSCPSAAAARALSDSREQPRRGARVHDLGAGAVERHEQAVRRPAVRDAHDLAQHRLVSAVDPVESPDGRRPWRLRSSSLLHTTRGLSTRLRRSATATRAPFANKATIPIPHLVPAGPDVRAPPQHTGIVQLPRGSSRRALRIARAMRRHGIGGHGHPPAGTARPASA